MTSKRIQNTKLTYKQPVSYTHLDVYKRQERERERERGREYQHEIEVVNFCKRNVHLVLVSCRLKKSVKKNVSNCIGYKVLSIIFLCYKNCLCKSFKVFFPVLVQSFANKTA